MPKQYPTNIKEVIISAIPNCATMALVMMNLNMWIYGAWTWEHAIKSFPIIYCTAFALDFFFAGPLVNAIAKKYNLYKYMIFMRVFLMAGTLTFLAPIIESGYAPTFSHYITALPRNYIIALATQALLAFPFGMYVLGLYRLHLNKKN